MTALPKEELVIPASEKPQIAERYYLPQQRFVWLHGACLKITWDDWHAGLLRIWNRVWIRDHRENCYVMGQQGGRTLVRKAWEYAAWEEARRAYDKVKRQQTLAPKGPEPLPTLTPYDAVELATRRTLLDEFRRQQTPRNQRSLTEIEDKNAGVSKVGGASTGADNTRRSRLNRALLRLVEEYRSDQLPEKERPE